MEIPALKILRQKLKLVEHELNVEIPKELNKAAAYGDLTDSAEYEMTKHRRDILQRQAADLMQRIEALSKIDLRKQPSDRVGLYSRVTIYDMDKDEERIYEIATAEEASSKDNIISYTSVIGRALMGKQVEEEVNFELPSGECNWVIIKLETVHDRKDEL